MTIKFRYYIFLIFLVYSFGTNANTTRKLIEVFPGPGLPSLESLGLTSEQLNDPNFIYKSNAEMFNLQVTKFNVSSNFVPECNNNNAPDSYDGAQACANYLWNLGKTMCVVPYPTIVMCSASDYSKIGGTCLIAGGSTQSYCSDVALGAQWVINNCWTGSGFIQGSQAANGNGNLIVTLQKNFF